MLRSAISRHMWCILLEFIISQLAARCEPTSAQPLIMIQLHSLRLQHELQVYRRANSLKYKTSAISQTHAVRQDSMHVEKFDFSRTADSLRNLSIKCLRQPQTRSTGVGLKNCGVGVDNRCLTTITDICVSLVNE